MNKPTLCSRLRDTLMKEARILLHAQGHPNIVRTIGICDSRSLCCLVMEFIEGWNLNDLLCSEDNEPDLDLWSTRLNIASQISDGMQFLHSLSPPVIHMDLKPGNVLVAKCDDRFHCKVYYASCAQLINSANCCSIMGLGIRYQTSACRRPD